MSAHNFGQYIFWAAFTHFYFLEVHALNLDIAPREVNLKYFRMHWRFLTSFLFYVPYDDLCKRDNFITVLQSILYFHLKKNSMNEKTTGDATEQLLVQMNHLYPRPYIRWFDISDLGLIVMILQLILKLLYLFMKSIEMMWKQLGVDMLLYFQPIQRRVIGFLFCCYILVD